MNGNDDMSCSNTEEAKNVTKCEEDEGTECEAGERDWFMKAHRIENVLSITCMKLIVEYFFGISGSRYIRLNVVYFQT